MVGPMCMQCEAKIDPLLLNPQRSTTDARVRCVCCGKLQYGYVFCAISGRDIVRRCIACENGPKAVQFWEEKPPPPFCKMVGPMCKQCEAKIDPLLLNPQRSTTDARVRCVCRGKLQYGYVFCTISGRGIVRRCIACENGPKAAQFWEEKPPPPDSAEGAARKA
ncbi:hypothetical protein PInf_017877 [Phytophthora infestans]|nr:hypothetical protein PInf_017877 [Phytophthora infestans]